MHAACVWAFLVDVFGDRVNEPWPGGIGRHQGAAIAFASLACYNYSALKSEQKRDKCRVTRALTKSMAKVFAARLHRVVVLENVPGFFQM